MRTHTQTKTHAVDCGRLGKKEAHAVFVLSILSNAAPEDRRAEVLAVKAGDANII